MVFSIVAMIAGIMLNIILIVFVIRFYILLQPKEIAAPVKYRIHCARANYNVFIATYDPDSKWQLLLAVKEL